MKAYKLNETLDLFEDLEVVEEVPQESKPQEEVLTQRKKRQYKSSSTRQSEILAAVVTILSRPNQERFTTKEIANEVGVSEACLYRHFSGKTEILTHILDYCDDAISGMFEKIDAIPNVTMFRRALWKVEKLLAFAEMNPGLSRLLTGEALIFEDKAVQDQRRLLVDLITKAVKGTLHLAIVNRELPNGFDAQARANYMMSYVQGRWLIFSQSKFKEKPTEDIASVERLISVIPETS